MEKSSEPLEREGEPIEETDKFGKNSPEPNFLPKLMKGSGTEEKKRGRQRSKEEVEELFQWSFRAMGRINTLHRAPAKITKWPYGLSDDMKQYYTKHYVRKDGKAHGEYLEYFYNTKAKKNHAAGPGKLVDLSTRRKNGIS